MTPASGKRARARARPPDGRPRPSQRRGQALVELAIIVPVLLFLLLGALDLGRIFYANITVANAAKEAALRASEGHTDAATVAALESSGGFVTISSGNVTVTPNPPCPDNTDDSNFGTTVTATVVAPFTAITPYVGAVIGGQTVSLTSSATAHCAVLPESATPPSPTPTPSGSPTPTPTPTPTPSGSPTPTPVPTPTPTPTPTPVPTPTPTPPPTPSPTPTPVCKVVPNLLGMTVSNARSAWTSAGFTGSFSPANGQNNKTVTGQSQTAGACLPATTTISVTYS